jgi:hypothetical protein
MTLGREVLDVIYELDDPRMQELARVAHMPDGPERYTAMLEALDDCSLFETLTLVRKRDRLASDYCLLRRTVEALDSQRADQEHS